MFRLLTGTACRKTICPADKLRLRLSDSGGLYLQIEPSGSRRWFWKYRFEGKEKRLALGSAGHSGIRPCWRFVCADLRDRQSIGQPTRRRQRP
ncbi:Arm DNA-binding domain-containing protein [Variovorax sp. E3]|uniref:Arm DNA-binding domain-containing protein n=1 Tax=Variovorax sp. E3 TaxID=1914993 RepID=UPI0035B255D9